MSDGMVGKEGEPFEFRVEYGKVREFARATKSKHPEHLAEDGVAPVTLPPGRLRLATRPSATGSLLVVKTMGIVVVVAFATTAAGVLVAAMTATER